VFRDVRRVLADDGVLWLNLGDSYVSVGGTHDGRDDNQPGVGAKRVWRDGAGRADGVVDERGQRNRNGVTLRSLPAKNLIGIPWRVAFALQADGWYLRSDVIWAKPNPMPESVTDRPTKSHEYVFLLSKSERYYYDAAAIAEPAIATNAHDVTGQGYMAPGQTSQSGNRKSDAVGFNGRNVQSVNAESERRDIVGTFNNNPRLRTNLTRNARTVWSIATQPYRDAHFAVMPEALAARCVLAGSRTGDTVLDPFAGAGTTGVAALSNGRSFIGCEANTAYVAMADTRLRNVAPLFTEATA
jgi:DNA modification methylase